MQRACRWPPSSACRAVRAAMPMSRRPSARPTSRCPTSTTRRRSSLPCDPPTRWWSVIITTRRGSGGPASCPRPRRPDLLEKLTYFQAVVIGLLQGVTELFPISSLGHSVLVPALLGWDQLVRGETSSESFYLAFVVGLHVATAIALLVFFREDWVKIIGGFFRS